MTAGSGFTGTIEKPDVFVKQVFETASPTLIPPALNTVIVGVNNQIEYKANAGLYDGTATSYSYPKLTVGAIVDITSVGVYLTNQYGTFLVDVNDYNADADSVDVEANIKITRNIVSSVGTGETTASQTINSTITTDGVTDASLLTFNSASSDFSATGLNVKPGMQLFLTNGADEGIFIVDQVISPTQLKVRTTKLFTSFVGAASISFRIITDYSQFVDPQADYLDEGVLAGMDVIIEDGPNVGTWRIEKVVSDIELLIEQTISLLGSKATRHTGDTAIGTTFTDIGLDFLADGVKSGDQLVIESGADVGTYSIDTVGTTTLTVSGIGFTAATTGVDYRIVRKFTTSQNVNYRIDLTSEKETGSILIGYTARRTDNIDDLITIQTTDEIISKLGAITPENPLAFGVWLAAQNTDTVVYATAIAEDEVLDWTKASEFLEAHEVYAIVPLTSNPAVHQIWSAHVTQQSDEASKHERIVFINRDLFIFTERLNSNTGNTDSIGTTFNDSNVDFGFSEIVPGDFIRIKDINGVITESARVLTVNGPTQIEVVAPGLTPSLVNATYVIESKPFDKTEQATFIKNYSKAFANRRVYNIWPDTVEIAFSNNTRGNDVFDTSDDNATVLAPGFYQGCIVAGMISNYSPQQPFTNLAVTGIIGLRNSNKYFSPFQLDTIATGGTYIMVQDIPTAPAYSRHQLSTDISLIEKRELSITKDVDFVAKFYRDQLRPYIGKYNITKVYLEMLTSVCEGINKFLIENGQLINANVVELKQDETQPDTVRITVDILVPYPANYIRVTLLI